MDTYSTYPVQFVRDKKFVKNTVKLYKYMSLYTFPYMDF